LFWKAVTALLDRLSGDDGNKRLRSVLQVASE